MTKFNEKYQARGFQAIAVDTNNDDPREEVQELARKLKLSHTILLGGAEASNLYEVEQVLPTAFWIDHRGRVVRRETGFRPELEKEIEAMISQLLSARDAETGKGGKP